MGKMAHVQISKCVSDEDHTDESDTSEVEEAAFDDLRMESPKPNSLERSEEKEQDSREVERGCGKDFIDQEAELSGDEDSDNQENDDDYDSDAILEELIDDSTALSDEKILKQIGPVLVKQRQDEDSALLGYFVKNLIEDGDLHTDGPSRKRKFTWQDATGIDGDEVSETENLAEEVENDNLEDYSQEKVKWRCKKELAEDPLQEVPDKSNNLQFNLNIMGGNKVSVKKMKFNGSNSPRNPLLTYKGMLTYHEKNVVKQQAKPSFVPGSGGQTTKHFIFKESCDTEDLPSSSKQVSSRQYQVPKSVFEHF